MEVVFRVDGAETLQRNLDFAAEEIGDLRKPMDEIGSVELKTFDMNFEGRGALFDDNGKWAPRKPRYYAGGRIDDWPLLERTGKLREGFQKKVGNTWVRLFNPTPYFAYHQQGTAKMPRRVLMKLREQDARMVVTTLQAYCISVLRRRGLR